MPATAARRSRRRSLKQLDEMDYAPSFQMGHPKAFELAARHAALLPGDLNHAFYCNSGSEAVGLARSRSRSPIIAPSGEGTRTRFVGRERGYHGVGFGGISVGGMVNNRKWFGAMLPGVDHLPHTHLAKNAFSRGQPEHGSRAGRRAGSASSACTTPPTSPRSSSSPVPARPATCRRPRATSSACARSATKHGILLIFDEVITGFGRLGTSLRRRQVRRHSRPDDGRQGHQQCHGAAGRRVRAQDRCSTA